MENNWKNVLRIQPEKDVDVLLSDTFGGDIQIGSYTINEEEGECWTLSDGSIMDLCYLEYWRELPAPPFAKKGL